MVIDRYAIDIFKANNQLGLYNFENELPEVVRKPLDRTQEKSFYNLVFRNINERDYKVLNACPYVSPKFITFTETKQ